MSRCTSSSAGRGVIDLVEPFTMCATCTHYNMFSVYIIHTHNNIILCRKTMFSLYIWPNTWTDSNLGVQSIKCVIRVYNRCGSILYSARACTPRVVLEKGTFYPNPLIRRFMDVYINWCIQTLIWPMSRGASPRVGRKSNANWMLNSSISELSNRLRPFRQCAVYI